MPRTDGHHASGWPGWVRLGSAWITLLLTSPALGHSMAVTRGTAVVDGDSLIITLVARGEDLFHVQDLRPDSNGAFALEDVRRAAEAHGEALRRSIVVRDSGGEPIDGLLGSWTLDAPGAAHVEYDVLRSLRMGYTLLYDLPPGVELVSFQHRVESERPVPLSGIVLHVTAADSVPRIVQLTGGGNVEIVRLVTPKRDNTSSDDPGAHAGQPVCNPHAFVLMDAQQTIRAVVRVDGTGMRTDVFLPVGMLETWQPIPRTRRDFLEAVEQVSSTDNIARLMESHNPLSINGNVVDGKVVAIEFLDVGDPGDEAARVPRRLSALTSRVRVRMKYRSPRPPRTLDLTWTLFNPAILTAHAMVVADGRCFEWDLSTYDPHLHWTRK